jgi:hypothetical protein
LDRVRQVGREGAGNPAASKAWREIAKVDVGQVTRVLEAMDDATLLASNWLRAAVDTILERALEDHGKLPVAQLEQFLRERTHSPRPRRLAYEWIVKADPTAPDRLIPQMLDDSSLELRRDAVEQVMRAADQAKDDQARRVLYEKALKSARDIDQVKTCAAALEKLGNPVDLAAQLGFIVDWSLIGPFDNTGQAGFDVVYPPEEEYEPDATYEGKIGPVRWTRYRTSDGNGLVDLNEALAKYSGAVAYAAFEFQSDRDQEVQVRLGCINASKVWVGGRLASADEVYHTGMELDQYTSTVQLQRGKNLILVKICQNEQTEDWAQQWRFQLRVTDSLGGAVRPGDSQP